MQRKEAEPWEFLGLLRLTHNRRDEKGEHSQQCDKQYLHHSEPAQ